MKTHYKKAFDSPYLSSADIDGETVLTIDHVSLEPDKSKRTKDKFNTAYFVEKEIRPGEKLKPMILNVGNSKAVKDLTGSKYLEDWKNVRVSIYVDQKVKFGKDVVEGLRIRPYSPKEKEDLTPNHERWAGAVESYKENKDMAIIKKYFNLSKENEEKLVAACG